MHIFCRVVVRYKCDDAAVSPGDEVQACLLFYFSEKAFFGTFLVFEFAADADPLIFVKVVLFFRPVKEQVGIVVFDVTQCGVYHDIVLSFCVFSNIRNLEMSIGTDCHIFSKSPGCTLSPGGTLSEARQTRGVRVCEQVSFLVVHDFLFGSVMLFENASFFQKLSDTVTVARLQGLFVLIDVFDQIVDFKQQIVSI